mmetsp:Transcript_133371/g.256658  ORF Transcript_133371/g.256658 Transcript_133371/m.256658 type:complete len:106 (-) Transcript_133371:79-396(-)
MACDQPQSVKQNIPAPDKNRGLQSPEMLAHSHWSTSGQGVIVMRSPQMIMQSVSGDTSFPKLERVAQASRHTFQHALDFRLPPLDNLSVEDRQSCHLEQLQAKCL